MSLFGTCSKMTLACSCFLSVAVGLLASVAAELVQLFIFYKSI